MIFLNLIIPLKIPEYINEHKNELNYIKVCEVPTHWAIVIT